VTLPDLDDVRLRKGLAHVADRLDRTGQDLGFATDIPWTNGIYVPTRSAKRLQKFA
jgi:hypothetical protein